MPNWCSNSLEIKGKRRDLIDLKNKVKDKQCFSCEKIIPYPNGNWDYAWCVENWGSKWDVSEPSLKDFKEIPQSVDFLMDNDWLEGVDTLHFCYTTAWSPITKVVEALSEQFPDCYFIHEFEEGGNGFHGIEEFLGGEMIRELDLPMTCTAEDEEMYKEDGIEDMVYNVDTIEELANSDEGYFDFAEEVLEKRGFERHKHKYD